MLGCFEHWCESCNIKKGAYLSTDDIKKHESKKLSDDDIIKKKNKIKVECDNFMKIE